MNVGKNKEENAMFREHCSNSLKIACRVFKMFKYMMHNDGIKLAVLPAKRREIPTLDFCTQFRRKFLSEGAVYLVAFCIPSPLQCCCKKVPFARADVEQSPFGWNIGFKNL